MKANRSFFFICLLMGIGCMPALHAQEFTAPLPRQSGRPASATTAQRPTVLGLPFFDDFTDEGTAPNSGLWSDRSVYLSNTMSNRQFSRGMAVFDANDAATVPYDSLNPYHLVWADSLTSRAIDLSLYAPSDSLWLSFYYEPAGNGFLPKPADSFILFFYNSNQRWVRVWQTGGDTAQGFKRIMVPVKDTGYFHPQFAFRFVNKATHGASNSNWNLDYVYLDAHRSFSDTAIQDVAFTQPPGNLLNDFTAMPYRQFQTDPSGFLADSLRAVLQNNGTLSASVPYGYQAQELLSGTALANASSNGMLTGGQSRQISFPMFSWANFNPPVNTDGKAVVQIRYFSGSLYPNEPVDNDTIIHNQTFDNYFAYDDGSAEKAYFLHLFPNAPGITALEYALYVPDTLRGVSIYFPRTVPPSDFKEFSLIVYKDIAVNGGSDRIIYQQDFYEPKFQDSVNKFHTYRFDQPVAMDAGVYYIGVMQAAGGFSDSLYIGLDVNRKNGNHRYYNVDGFWVPSTIAGALMVRPVVGAALPPTGIAAYKEAGWQLFPNPTRDVLHVLAPADAQQTTYEIKDMQGRTLMQGISGDTHLLIHTHSLSAGIYFFCATDDKGHTSVQKFVRQ